MKIIHLDTINSTNTYSKELLKTGKVPPFCVIADTQDSGYGQAFKPYFCPLGGLYMSLVLHESEFNHTYATAFVAICVARVVSRFISDGRKVTLKWINDILLGGKKIGGVLIDKVGECSIIGVGLNIMQTQPVPDELKDRMGFVFNETLKDFSAIRDKLAIQIIHEIRTTKITDEQVLAEF